MTIKCDKLKEIEFFDSCPKEDRILFGTIYFSDLEKNFKVFVDQGEDIVHLETAGLTEGTYWSKEIVDRDMDSYFKLIDLIVNYYSFSSPGNMEKDVIIYLESLIRDIINFGTIIHKQLILWDYIKNYDKITEFANVYVTEIEYLMGLVRSFFDLIYKIIVSLYGNLKPKLPFTFPDTLTKFYKRRSKFEIDGPMDDFFTEILPLFRLCKNIRDGIYHGGKTPRIVFMTEEGPGIGMQEIKGVIKDPFSDFKGFFDDDKKFKEHLLKNDIASVFYFINRIIQFSLDSTTSLANAIELTFEKPDPISNEFKVFLRSPNVYYINQIPNYLDQCWIRTKRKIILSEYK